MNNSHLNLSASGFSLNRSMFTNSKVSPFPSYDSYNLNNKSNSLHESQITKNKPKAQSSNIPAFLKKFKFNRPINKKSNQIIEKILSKETIPFVEKSLKAS